jgi:hypothetical protein
LELLEEELIVVVVPGCELGHLELLEEELIVVVD